MPLTPEQIAKIRQKEAETPDALKRNPLNDYTEGWFHVTLNVRDEAPVLGYVVGDPEAADGSQNAPRCVLTELGRRVEESWNTIPSYYPEVEIADFIAMPEHVHGLLHLKATNRVHLGQIIRGFMIGSTHGYWETLGIAYGKKEQKSSGIPQVSTDRDHTRSYRGPSLFVRGYNDVEALTADEVEIKRQYIRNNPRKRLITRSKPDLFLVHRNMKSGNWKPERIVQGLCADRFIAADRNKQMEAWRCLTIKGCVNSRGKAGATLKFMQIPTETTTAANASATLAATATTATGTLATTTTASRPVIDLVGNMELLQRQLFPLVCHRADAHRFEQQKAAVLHVAREQGGVIVTACVSPRERDVVKLLQQELLPVIEVMGNGFGNRYKPTGRNFYAVAEQRRLEVSPWEYEYRQHENDAAPDITREMCMVMNELVRMIARKSDDWWKDDFR